jgi:hypothetical protein
MMKKIKNSRLRLKIVPLAAMLALGMALTPISAMAKNGDSGHHKENHSKNVGKHYDRGNYRSGKHSYREPRHNNQKRSLGHKLKHDYGTRYGRHNDYGHRKHVRYSPRYDHHYDHRGHSTTHYVINDNHHRDHYIDYDPLRFMIGLHTNNFDITFRD